MRVSTRHGLREPWLWVLNAPAVFLVLSFSVLPIAYVGWLSLQDLRAGVPAGGWIGAANYRFVLADASTVTALRNTLYFAAASVGLATVVGLGVALLLDSRAPGAGWLVVGAVLPWSIPEIVNALLWQWIYNPTYGALNGALVSLGVLDRYRAWLSTPGSAMHAIIVAYAWKLVPFVVIILFAALRSVPADVYESAETDGAGPWRQLRHITWPLIAPAVAVAVTFCVVWSMRAFDIVYLLDEGRARAGDRPAELPHVHEGLRVRRPRRGSRRRLPAGRGHPRDDPRVPARPAGGGAVRRRLGWPQRIALGALVGLSLVYLLAPPAWMVLSSVSPDRELMARPPHWIPAAPTAEHYRTLFQLPGASPQMLDRNPQVRAFPRSLLNSVLIASGTVLLCLSFGSVSAYSLSRFVGRRARRSLLLALLATRMIPVVSILIPVYLWLQHLRLLNTRTGLVLAYAGLLLPFVIWILEGFYRGFPVELEEAAAIDGCSQLRTFTRIVLPLSTNALFAAGAFAFIASWSDFIVGLVLTTSEAAWPISVVLAQSLNPITEPSWGLLNGAGLVAALVPAVLAFLLRRTVMRGMLSGALKG